MVQVPLTGLLHISHPNFISSYLLSCWPMYFLEYFLFEASIPIAFSYNLLTPTVHSSFKPSSKPPPKENIFLSSVELASKKIVLGIQKVKE